MKFIIDAHLPKSIAAFFYGHDVIHTSELEEGNRTKDKLINSLSVLEDRTLITKDNDFYYSYIAAHRPPKLVLVKLGNMRLKELKEYFERNASRLIELLKEHSFLVLEKENIRVLE
jgi:predicted nuclease of predicted toxin-antitoxin system